MQASSNCNQKFHSEVSAISRTGSLRGSKAQSKRIYWVEAVQSPPMQTALEGRQKSVLAPPWSHGDPVLTREAVWSAVSIDVDVKDDAHGRGTTSVGGADVAFGGVAGGRVVTVCLRRVERTDLLADETTTDKLVAAGQR